MFAGLLLFPFLLLPLLQSGRMDSGWQLLPWIALPLAPYLIWRLCTERPGPMMNRLLASTARYQLALGLLLCARFIG